MMRFVKALGLTAGSGCAEGSPWIRIVLVAACLLSGAQPEIALAAPLATLSGNSAAAITYTPPPLVGNPPSAVDYAQGSSLSAACTGCITVRLPSYAAGSFDFSAAGFNWFDQSLSTISALATEDLNGNATISVSIGGTSTVLIGGLCVDFKLFAQLGTSNAVFQCQYQPAPSVQTQSSVLNLPNGSPIYLIVSGTASTPTAIGSITTPENPATVPIPYLEAITLDWYGMITTSPYSGQALVPVPNLVGTPQPTAVTVLQNQGFSLGAVITQTSATVPTGEVISENPPAGTTVPPGWAVDLTVSSGPPMVAVPNVVGLSQADAITALHAAGLAVNTIIIQPLPPTPTTSTAGQVYAQAPASGASLPAGADVALTVYGPTPITPTLTFTGDATSSINYIPYPVGAGANNVESVISGAENNPGSLYSLSGGFGAVDSNGNPVMMQLQFSGTAMPIGCDGVHGCYSALFPVGSTLTIFEVNSCISGPNGPEIGFNTCDWTQGSLTTGAIYAGNSWVSLCYQGLPGCPSLVNTASLQLAYTPTNTYSALTGITTEFPQATPGYVVFAGNTVTFPGYNNSPTPIDVTLCYLDPQGELCGPYGQNSPFGGAYQFGGFYNAFDIDWTAQLSPTPVLSPPPFITVPNVAGASQSAATSALVAAGFKPGTVSYSSSASVAAGKVISQYPSAGTVELAPYSVSLLISTGTGAALRGDINFDGQVDKADLALVTSALNQRASGSNDPRDLNKDGVINALDARLLVTLCTYAGCASNLP